MSGYAFYPEARNDLNEIRGFIAEDNPDAADRLVDDIMDAIVALTRMPHQGHRRPDLTSRPIRFLLVRRLPDRLCAGRPSAMGNRHPAHPPQPARHGGHSPKQGYLTRHLQLHRASRHAPPGKSAYDAGLSSLTCTTGSLYVRPLFVTVSVGG